MPRKLLRVALVAAILPVMAPETSSAQAVKPGSTVRTAAPAQPSKKGMSGWIQRLRGEKTAPNTAKIVKVSGEKAFAEPANSENPFELEGNEDVRLLKSNQPTRRRPSALVLEFEPSPESQQKPARPQPQPTAVATPVESDASNPFPDDAATQPRGRRAEAPEREEAFTDAVEATATPVEGEDAQPDAFPIEGAAPPMDVNAGFEAAAGTTPRYRRTNQTDTPTTQVEVPEPDAAGAPVAAEPQAQPAQPMQPNRPLQAQPMGRMNAGPAVVNAPRSNLPVYPQGAVPVPVYGGNAGYARLDGALYPSPRQDIPAYVGSTMITNPALDPHEMLYAHRYRGLYGPFYHKTQRQWILTPIGIYKNEKRTLVGTEVRVNYKSSISPFSLFFPPYSR